jgi:hypothetical protein
LLIAAKELDDARIQLILETTLNKEDLVIVILKKNWPSCVKVKKSTRMA